MQKADALIQSMKQRTDALVASDEKLQQFLMWVNQKSLSVKVPYKLAAVRAFYFALDRARDHSLVLALDRDLVCALDCRLDCANDLSLDRGLVPALVRGLEHAFERTCDPVLIRALERAIDPVFKPALQPELEQRLQELKQQLPDPNIHWEIFECWWEVNGKAWIEQIRAVIINHRNVGHNWQFSEQHREVLQQYYDANKLLVDCLHSSSKVTLAVRKEIEETLLLPIAEIEKRHSGQDKSSNLSGY